MVTATMSTPTGPIVAEVTTVGSTRVDPAELVFVHRVVDRPRDWTPADAWRAVGLAIRDGRIRL